MTTDLVVPRRTQTERRRDSEERLIRGAIDVIASHGVGGLTFEAIARTSGMSRGSVTQRFGSKQGLIDAILIYLHDNHQARLRAEGIDRLAGMAAITAYIDMSFTRMAQTSDTRAYFLLLSSALNDAEGLRGRFRETHAKVEEQLTIWISEGQAHGSIGAEVAGQPTALMIGCVMFGASMQLLTDPGMDIWPVRDAVLQTLRKSLAI